jgi:hypothetical protein
MRKSSLFEEGDLFDLMLELPFVLPVALSIITIIGVVRWWRSSRAMSSVSMTTR